MLDADLAIVGISELATPEGTTARRGEDLGRLRILTGAAVACLRGRIVFVGPESELAQATKLLPGARVLDAGRGTVVPGFVDAHTHLPFAGWRESEFNQRLGGAAYSEIASRGGGILSTVRATRESSLEDLTARVRGRLDEMLALGTTTVEAKSGYGLSIEDEIKQLEAVRRASEGHAVRVVPTFLGAHTVPEERRTDRARYVEQVVSEMIPEVAARGLARYADVFVDAHAFSIEEARRVLEAAKARGLGLRVHADQLADDGAAKLAAELGAASADHLEHVSPEGVGRLAASETVAVLLPTAAFFLMQEKRPPARGLVDAGAAVAIATDFNPGTSPTSSMGEAMVHASLGLRLSIDETLTAATLNAAHSLGVSREAGSVEVGKRADLVIHDVPNRYHLVYRLGVPRVRFVVADGRVAYDQKRGACSL